MKKAEIIKFQKIVWDFYIKNKRDLPWRKVLGKRKVSPYEILVSEFMLQQTQVDRVVPKFLAFLERFPTMETLAQSSQKDVLLMWSGLGYNRRALYLHKAVQTILDVHRGVFPKTPSVLRALSGVGDYMSKILPVFIYNQKEVLIETNIRTVYLHHFFKDTSGVTDAQILEVLEQTLPEKDYREWYYALMDYGTYLKKVVKVKNTQSKHYTKQKPFKGSLRYVRGTLLKKLVLGKILKSDVYDMFPEYTSAQVEKVCEDLVKEGLIKEDRKYFRL